VAKIPVGFDNSIVGTDNIDQLINAPNDDKPTNSSDDNTEPKVDLQINRQINNVSFKIRPELIANRTLHS
jgi:hypothetical protein